MSDFPESAEMQKQVSNIMNQGMELVDLFVNKKYMWNEHARCLIIYLN